MAPAKAISVTLGAQHSLLERRLDSGMYDDASDVVRHALRALDREDAALDEILRAKVRASMANKKPSIPAEAVFSRIEARHARKVKATKRGA
ncbi:ribbon-helix-helix domain-containing protein [Bradyrhizobium sp.]|uniref:ribbon-helix-helix domain-containing protein n=1 Tax=Bradyrhizobium sp. TaxID=376 RepID=UPI003C744C2E